MLNSFDSRALGRTDCFGQRFMRPGRYAYGIAPAGGHAIATERPFTITVRDAEKDAEMKQHTVLVGRGRNGLAPDHAELEIATGDLVLWNCTAGDAVPIAVIGEKDFFDSHRMTNECGYSHAFGKAGDYEWTDAYGSGLGGKVKVVDPDCKDEAGFKRWHKALSEGALVMIQDGKAKPRQIEIMTGQTVYFAVVTSPGISITDARLLEEQKGYAMPCDSGEEKKSGKTKKRANRKQA